jgi:hypothetical protein
MSKRFGAKHAPGGGGFFARILLDQAVRVFLVVLFPVILVGSILRWEAFALRAWWRAFRSGTFDS